MTQAIPGRYTAATLGILFGFLGLHKFYMREYGTGIVMFLLSIILGLTFIVPVIVGTIGFVQGVSYMFWTDEDWAKRFTQKA